MSPYVSRAGQKLRGAMDWFKVSAQGLFCVDVGSSTGGFSDCLIRDGAAEVWAIDVGYGLLDYNLKKNPRVHLLERTNIRFMESTAIPRKADLVTIDVSFISLAKILPKIKEISTPETIILAMVKPQFEGTPKEVPGGFVRDEATRQAIIERVKEQVLAQQFQILGAVDSTVKGRKGNQELFLHLKQA